MGEGGQQQTETGLTREKAGSDKPQILTALLLYSPAHSTVPMATLKKKKSVCQRWLVYDRQETGQLYPHQFLMDGDALDSAPCWCLIGNNSTPLLSSPFGTSFLFSSLFKQVSSQALISVGEVYSCSEFSAPRSSGRTHFHRP